MRTKQARHLVLARLLWLGQHALYLRASRAWGPLPAPDKAAVRGALAAEFHGRPLRTLPECLARWWPPPPLLQGRPKEGGPVALHAALAGADDALAHEVRAALADAPLPASELPSAAELTRLRALEAQLRHQWQQVEGRLRQADMPPGDRARAVAAVVTALSLV